MWHNYCTRRSIAKGETFMRRGIHGGVGAALWMLVTSACCAAQTSTQPPRADRNASAGGALPLLSPAVISLGVNAMPLLVGGSSPASAAGAVGTTQRQGPAG